MLRDGTNVRFQRIKGQGLDTGLTNQGQNTVRTGTTTVLVFDTSSIAECACILRTHYSHALTCLGFGHYGTLDIKEVSTTTNNNNNNGNGRNNNATRWYDGITEAQLLAYARREYAMCLSSSSSCLCARNDTYIHLSCAAGGGPSN